MDAPDWILAEISVLAKISSVRMKLIVSQVPPACCWHHHIMLYSIYACTLSWQG
jgi:hypothetical protein